MTPEDITSAELFRTTSLGEINEETANPILELIYGANIEDQDLDYEERRPIDIIINSPGGDVYSAMALHDAIESSKTPIHVIIMGKAMSAALIVVAAAHTKSAGKRTTFMYHEMSWQAEANGTFHKNEVKEYERFQKIYDNILIEKCERVSQKLLNSKKKSGTDWYFNSEEAKKLGLIDDII